MPLRGQRRPGRAIGVTTGETASRNTLPVLVQRLLHSDKGRVLCLLDSVVSAFWTLTFLLGNGSL